jgi:hypothetical protein
MSVGKVALCVGINDYPGTGNDLHGCVNDALGWADLLAEAGYSVTTLLDGQATKDAIMGMLEGFVLSAKWRDRIVFTFSGHGTWVPDDDGDEPDGRDEALCAVDFQNGGLIIDDDMFRLQSLRRMGVRFTTFSDSCHSGSVHRFASIAPDTARGIPRFMPPEQFLSGAALQRAKQAEHLPAKGVSRSLGVLFSGCDDPEYSYDAWIGGRPQGAFSEAAIRTFDATERGYLSWHKRIRAILPSSAYPQTPQLQGTYYQKRFWSL